MNIQEIIESGIIKLYVMNALTDEEAKQIEALAQQYPEIRLEIQNVQLSLENDAQVPVAEPNIQVESAILEKINTEMPQILTHSAALKPINTPLSKLPWLVAMAAFLTAVVFGILYFNQKKALADCAAENVKIIENQRVTAHKLAIFRSDDTKTVEMKGLEIAPNSKVLVYWNPKEQATFLAIQNLPEPTKGNQYQLWAIVDKKPVNAGILAYDLAAVQSMKGFEKAEAFAVTLEPEGGSTEPTLSNMYVLGTVFN